MCVCELYGWCPECAPPITESPEFTDGTPMPESVRLMIRGLGDATNGTDVKGEHSLMRFASEVGEDITRPANLSRRA